MAPRAGSLTLPKRHPPRHERAVERDAFALALEEDLIEAHKWFNLAAVNGHEDAAGCRADISDEMTAREIAEAQRRAREWLSEGTRRAA